MTAIVCGSLTALAALGLAHYEGWRPRIRQRCRHIRHRWRLHREGRWQPPAPELDGGNL